MKQAIAIVAIASAMLSACGGGSSSNSVNISSEADPTDKYVGTWKGPCYSSTAVTQKADGKSTNIITALKISKLTSSTANAEINLTVYSNGDTTCSGRAIGSIVKTGRTKTLFLRTQTELSAVMVKTSLPITPAYRWHQERRLTK